MDWGPIVCYYCRRTRHIKGPSCELWARHMKEKEELAAGPSAPVNTVKIAAFVVTRSQSEGGNQDPVQAADEEEHGEDWRRLDATQREVEEQIRQQQRDEERPQPERLVGLEPNTKMETEILETTEGVKAGFDLDTREPMTAGAEGEGVETGWAGMANRIVQLISQTKVDMTVEELFRIAPQCKEMVLRKLRGSRTMGSLPKVPLFQADVGHLNDRGAYVQICVRGVKLENVLLDGGSTVNLMSEKTYH